MGPPPGAKPSLHVSQVLHGGVLGPIPGPALGIPPPCLGASVSEELVNRCFQGSPGPRDPALTDGGVRVVQSTEQGICPLPGKLGRFTKHREGRQGMQVGSTACACEEQGVRMS